MSNHSNLECIFIIDHESISIEARNAIVKAITEEISFLSQSIIFRDVSCSLITSGSRGVVELFPLLPISCNTGGAPQAAVNSSLLERYQQLQDLFQALKTAERLPGRIYFTAAE